MSEAPESRREGAGNFYLHELSAAISLGKPMDYPAVCFVLPPNSVTLSSWEKYSSPLIIFLALLWTRSNRWSSTSFLCCRSQSWMPYSGWGLTRAELRGRITSLFLLPTMFLMQPGCCYSFLGCKKTSSADVGLLVKQDPRILLWALLDPFFLQPVFVLRSDPNQVQDLLGFAGPHEVCTCTSLKLVRFHPLDGIFSHTA